MNMRMDAALKDIIGHFGPRVLKLERKSDNRAYIEISPSDIVPFVKFIFKDLGFRFNIASGVDTFTGIEILYHFSLDESGIVITLRVLLRDKKDPRIDTITSVTKAAWWIEREIHELFGVGFNSNTDLRPLLLPDDWPKGVFPLRKDFIAHKRDSRKA